MVGQLPRSTDVVSVGASPVGLTLTRQMICASAPQGVLTR